MTKVYYDMMNVDASAPLTFAPMFIG
jgi:hypothetical protein